MTDPLNWIEEELQSLRREGLLRARRQILPLPGGRCLVDGKEAWDFASNDYLGLASDPRVIEAAQSALSSHGVGSRASALVSGRSDIHAALEQSIADFEGTEAAILFPTGMAANLGTVAALASQGDVVFCDRFNHASLVDGCRLSGARLRVYRHEDLSKLAKLLEKESARRKFVVTDSVFSMDGDLAPLRELCDLCDEFNATLIVDEAHGTGVFGQHGRGVAELMGVEDRVPVRIGTLSKSLGALGGFVVGQKSLIDFLWNKARTQIYSTALPPSVCAAALESIKIVQAEPCRRESLLASAETFRASLKNVGIEPLDRSIGPIVPIVLHDPDIATLTSEKLLAAGFLVGAIRPPTVPNGTSRLRVTLHYGLPAEILTRLAQSIAEASK